MLPSGLLAEEEIELGNGIEWIDGQAVEKPPMGAEAGLVSGKLFTRLQHYVDSNTQGFVFTSDVGYQIRVGSSRRVRKPDMTFVARGRFPDDRIPRGNVTIAPDLAVEVVSPNDLAEDIDQRITDFLSVGTRLFWVVYPATHSVLVLRHDGSAARLTETQELTGEDIVPGFSCPIVSLFAGI